MSLVPMRQTGVEQGWFLNVSYVKVSSELNRLRDAPEELNREIVTRQSWLWWDIDKHHGLAYVLNILEQTEFNLQVDCLVFRVVAQKG